MEHNILQHNGFHEEIYGAQVDNSLYEIPLCKTLCLLQCQSISSCRFQVIFSLRIFRQVTSFSDHEEREEPASQSEIVVEAEVSFSLWVLQNLEILSQTLHILTDLDRFF